MSDKSEKKTKVIKISSIKKRKSELNHVEEPIIKNSFEETQFGDYLLESAIQESLLSKESLSKESGHETKKTERHGYYISAEQWQMLNQIKENELLKRTISVITNEVIMFEEGLCQYPSLEYGINIAESEINREKREEREREKEREKEKEVNGEVNYKKEDLIKIREKFLSNLENKQ
jgi:hypothetical protein